MIKALFFPVFVNDFDEIQLITLKRKYGIRGYGVYTFLRTKLQDVDNYEYPIKLIPDLAYLAGVPEDEMQDIIYNSGLFVVGNDYFSCPALDEALYRHNGIKAKRSEQGKKGGLARMSTLTPEQRSELGKKAINKRWGKNSNEIPAHTSEYQAKNENAGIIPSNEIDIEIEMEIEKEIEMEKDIEKESEIENDIESKKVSSLVLVSQDSTSVSSSQNPISFFSPSELQYQIDSYLKQDSKFFSSKNQDIVTNGFIEFRKEYPQSKASLEAYESVLYAYLYSSLAYSNNYSNSKDFNEVLGKQQSIVFNPSNIMDLMKSIKDKSKSVREVYENIISTVNAN